MIATGGLAELIKSYAKELEMVEPFLPLHGIRIGFELLTVRNYFM